MTIPVGTLCVFIVDLDGELHRYIGSQCIVIEPYGMQECEDDSWLLGYGVEFPDGKEANARVGEIVPLLPPPPKKSEKRREPEHA